MRIDDLKKKSYPELIRLAHEHEPNAFTALTEKFKHKLNGFAHALARNHNDEEDIENDVLLRIDQVVEEGSCEEDEDAFIKLLYTITKNATVDFYRSEPDDVHNDTVIN